MKIILSVLLTSSLTFHANGQDNPRQWTKLMAVGGYPRDSFYKVEIVDISGNNLTCQAIEDYPVQEGSVGTFIGGRPIVCGGSTMEGVFDYTYNECYTFSYARSWQSEPSMHWSREFSTGVKFEGDDQNWFVTGGYNDGNYNAYNEKFNVVDNDFSDSVSLPKATYFHNLVSVNYTHMVLLGGHEATTEVLIFDRNLFIWFDLPPMPTARSACQAGLVTYPDGSQGILVAGGFDEFSNGIETVDFLNLQTLIWEPKQSLPMDIHLGQSAPYLDSFIIAGGFSAALFEYLDTVLYYNPALDQWDQIAKMSYKRDDFTAFLVPDSFPYCH